MSTSQIVALVMAAVIVGVAVWRIMNSTQTWWTAVVAVLAVIGVGLFVYYMASGGRRDDGDDGEE